MTVKNAFKNNIPLQGETCNFDSLDDLERSVKAWEKKRNSKKCRIKWNFTREKAGKKLSNIIHDN